MKKKVVLVLFLLALLALVAVPALADHGWPPIQPPPSETRTLYGTPSNPLGWGRTETPHFSDYSYVVVSSCLTSVTTGVTQYRYDVVVHRNGSVALHSDDVDGSGRPWVYMFHVLTDYKPEVYLGHIPDDYYTGYVEITWVR